MPGKVSADHEPRAFTLNALELQRSRATTANVASKIGTSGRDPQATFFLAIIRNETGVRTVLISLYFRFDAEELLRGKSLQQTCQIRIIRRRGPIPALFQIYLQSPTVRTTGNVGSGFRHRPIACGGKSVDGDDRLTTGSRRGEPSARERSRPRRHERKSEDAPKWRRRTAAPPWIESAKLGTGQTRGAPVGDASPSPSPVAESSAFA